METQTSRRKIILNIKINNMKKTFFLAATVAITSAACKSSKEVSKTETPVVKSTVDCAVSGLTYAAIKPILEGNCNSCHSNGGAGGLDFTVFADVKKAAQKGELLGTIKHASGFPKMPARAEKLDQASIDKIECWIKNGMKE
jgi:cytochrome c5